MSEKPRFVKYATIATAIMMVLIIAFVVYNKKENEPSTPSISVSSVEPNFTLQDSIVNFGMKFLGTPYVAAGMGEEGFDCSGFVYYVFNHNHIKVPRSSADFENFGKEIPIENVQKGDILLFLSPTQNVIGHIGIVSNPKGSKSDFIHASSGRQMKVIISNLSTTGYAKRFIKAIRVN